MTSLIKAISFARRQTRQQLGALAEASTKVAVIKDASFC